MTIIDKQSELKTLARAIYAGLATEEDLSKVDEREVIAIKTDLSEPRLAYSVTEKAMMGTSGRTRKFVASSERADRTGDIVRVAGWDFKDFSRNPVALWSHLQKELPLGTVSNIEPDASSRTLFESIDFVSEDLNPFAHKILGLIDASVIKGSSVGFLPLEAYSPVSADERKAIGLGRLGVEYRKQAQIELSVCNVPAHQDALSTKAISDALGDLVRTKKLTEDQAKALMPGDEPLVFALGSIEPIERPVVESTDITGVTTTFTLLPDTFKQHDERIDKLIAALERSTTALSKSLEMNVALAARLDALDERVNKIQPTQTKQAPAPVSRTDDSTAYFEKVFAAVGNRVNGSKTKG